MASQARILVVDDDVDTADLIKFSLISADYHVAIANSGQEALDMTVGTAFDLILLDIMMPDLSGFDVMRKLHEMERPTPPVIFFTARNRPEDQEVGDELGAIACMLKPATRGELLDVIRSTLEEPSPDIETN